MTASLPRGSEIATAGGTRTDVVRQTAARLFEASGYAATTMNDIAEAVGILPGSLYHHFRSKEDIAIDLLTALGQALDALATAASRRPVAAGPDAVVRLGADVTALSFQHAAAVRLRAHEVPPTVSTERFVQAMRLPSPALDRAWRAAVAALPPPAADPGLLRFALQTVTVYAPAYYPTTMDPRAVAAHVCDILLHGLVRECPDDEQLDSSTAAKAALDVFAGWPSRDRPAAANDREAIVAAARAEFARRGYEETTIRDIANAAGVGMGTLYRRVESKEALLREIIDGYGARFDEAFRAVLGAGSSVPEALDGLARVFVHISRRFHEESRIVNYGWSRRQAESSPLHGYFVATEARFAQLEKLLRRGVRAGLLRSVAPPTETALHLRSLLWLRYQDHARTSESRALRFIRDSVLRGALSPR